MAYPACSALYERETLARVRRGRARVLARVRRGLAHVRRGGRGSKVKGMPDQSSASTEHAIMQEITAPLATLPDDAVPIAADVDFPIVLRGYDRIAVDAYVKKTTQLVAELQATHSPESAVRRALERVGEEVSGILQRAHDTAAEITAKSRSEAEDRLESARRETAQLKTRAADEVKELDLETDRIWEERLRIVEDARELARQLMTLADSAVERFPADETESTEAALRPEIAEIFSAGADSAVGGAVGDDREDAFAPIAGEEDALAPVAGDDALAPVPQEGDALVEADDAPAELAAAGDEPLMTPPEAEDGEPEPPPGLSGTQQGEPHDRDATIIMPPLRPSDKDAPLG